MPFSPAAVSGVPKADIWRFIKRKLRWSKGDATFESPKNFSMDCKEPLFLLKQKNPR